MREEWHIAVRNRRVRIEYRGEHYYTSSQFERKESAEGLAALFRIGVLEYGYPFADDRNPAPPVAPKPDPAAPENRQERAGRIAARNLMGTRGVDDRIK